METFNWFSCCKGTKKKHIDSKLFITNVGKQRLRHEKQHGKGVS
jgi:hypothetical protein